MTPPWLTRLRRLILGEPSNECVLRTAATRAVAELWLNLLADHGVPARVASALPANFMGDGIQHRLIVRSNDAEEAEAILRAYWDSACP